MQAASSKQLACIRSTVKQLGATGHMLVAGFHLAETGTGHAMLRHAKWTKYGASNFQVAKELPGVEPMGRIILHVLYCGVLQRAASFVRRRRRTNGLPPPSQAACCNLQLDLLVVGDWIWIWNLPGDW
jgi:hypothetical protein